MLVHRGKHVAAISPQLLHRRLFSAAPRHSIAIVGAGPAGFYTAARLLRRQSAARIDVFDAAPVPFGLVRFGVAPDHPEVKAVTIRLPCGSIYTSGADINFYGNCPLNAPNGVALHELRERYSAVVLACGSSSSADHTLNLPGESEAHNVVSARACVAWYNSDFRASSLPRANFRLDRLRRVSIVGAGNVALDVARILLSPAESLAATDIHPSALEALKASSVSHVDIIARRGPMELAFTTKEFREMLHIPELSFSVNHPEMFEHALVRHKEALKLDRPRRRLLELLAKSVPCSSTTSAGTTKSWTLHLMRSPTQLVTDAHNVTAMRLGVNEYIDRQASLGRVQATPSHDVLSTDLVIRSIGYAIQPIDASLPFDHAHGCIPNTMGRVVDANGVYVSGWLKRGPRGVIASTRLDAYETADSLIEDMTCPASTHSTALPNIEELLSQRSVRWVSWPAWQQVDAWERSCGAALGKVRCKVQSVDDVWRILDQTST